MTDIYIPGIIHAETFALGTSAQSLSELLLAGSYSGDATGATALLKQSQSVRIASAVQDHVYLISPDSDDPVVTPREGEYILADTAYSVDGADNISRWKGIAVTGTARLTVMFYG